MLVFFCLVCYALCRSPIACCITISMRDNSIILGVAKTEKGGGMMSRAVKVDCKAKASKWITLSIKLKLLISFQLGS